MSISIKHLTFAAIIFMASACDKDTIEPEPNEITPSEAVTHPYVEIAGLKWSTENLAVTESGMREFNGTGHINGDYFQWAAHEDYTEASGSDRGLVIYQSFASTMCKDTDNGFSFKSLNGKTYHFYQNPDESEGRAGITPYYNGSAYTKYTSSAQTPLDAQDDVASICWGESWRLPTCAEFQALVDATKWTWDKTDKGYYVTNKDEALAPDKSNALLFFPAAGYGYSHSLDQVGSYGRYMTSNLSTTNSENVYLLYLNSFAVNPKNSYSRCRGYSVRPVSD